MCTKSSFILFGLKLFFFLSAVEFQPCCSAPQSYQGALTWDWDYESSGNGDPEEAITTLTDSTGSQSWIQISSERWGDHERPLPKNEQVRFLIYSNFCCTRVVLFQKAPCPGYSPNSINFSIDYFSL